MLRGEEILYTLFLRSQKMNTLKSASSTYKSIFCVSCAFLWLFFIAANFAFAYSGGDGSPENPYQIADVNDLLELAADVNNYVKCFILTADIDLDPNLPGRQVFNNAVISKSDPHYTFVGTFDGDDHKISNLTINTNPNTGGCLGLFGVVGTDIDGGTIKNLGLENVSIISSNYSTDVGGLVGSISRGIISNCYSVGISINVGDYPNYIGGLVGHNDIASIISNCYSKGIIITGGVYGRNPAGYIGGLVGGNAGDIIYSYSTCDINGGDYLGSVGGLVGVNGGEYGEGLIENCYSTGTVRVYNGGGIGGLVGGSSADINNCFSTSKVIGLGGSFDIGGLAGSQWWNDIYNCYSTGDVNGGDGSYDIGGLVGMVGEGYGSFINNCYSTGVVNVGVGSNSIGGLIGAIDLGAVNNSYFLDTSGPNNGYGTPLTDPNMKKQASFVGWDFLGETINGTDDIWSIKEDVNYPVLVWPLVNLVSSQFGWYKVNFEDFSVMASWWNRTDCATNNDCDGADFDFSGTIDMADLEIFCRYWLAGTTD